MYSVLKECGFTMKKEQIIINEKNNELWRIQMKFNYKIQKDIREISICLGICLGLSVVSFILLLVLL